MKAKIKRYVFLHMLLFVFSMSSVCSKLAAGEAFMSFRFMVLYGAVIALLGIYAVFWQQIIKNMPLTAAYANRAVTVFWGMVWGLLIFREKITPGKAAGALLVIAGIILFAISDREETREDAQGHAEDAVRKENPQGHADSAKGKRTS